MKSTYLCKQKQLGFSRLCGILCATDEWMVQKEASTQAKSSLSEMLCGALQR